MLEQFWGPQGELAAACRYFTQYLAEEDPGRKDMLIDIATEELCHLESKALYSIQPNFPPGKLPGVAEFTNVYFDFRQASLAVDGGTGMGEPNLTSEEVALVDTAAARLAADTSADPVTGAMLGMRGGTEDPQAAKTSAQTLSSSKTSRKSRQKGM